MEGPQLSSLVNNVTEGSVYSRPTVPRTIGGVLDDMFGLYRSALSVCWPIALIYAVVVSATNGVIALNAQEQSSALKLMAPVIVVASYLLWGIAGLTLEVASIERIYAVISARELSIKDALVKGLRLLPRALLAWTMLFLAVVLGLLLLLIPGVMFGVLFCLYNVLIVVEDKSASDALASSKALIEGNWWRVAAVLTMIGIVGGIFRLLAEVVSVYVVALATTNVGVILLTEAVAAGIASLFTMPLYVAMKLSLYFDLKLRKEGGDLAGRVAALQQA